MFPHHRSGRLMLEFTDESGAKKRVSLGHVDVERGKAAADDLAAELRRSDRPRSSELTLLELFDIYERQVTPTKSASSQAHDRRARRLLERCWGPGAVVKDLGRLHWDTFINDRRSGALRHDGDDRRVQGVRDRAIEQDLRFMLAVCNWAETVKVNGNPLLMVNPLRRLPVPTERNPDRPTTTDAEFELLAMAATKLGNQVELYLLLTHETGHRCSAVRLLRWSDIDLDSGWVTWNEGRGNKRFRHSAPLSSAALDALRAARRASARIGDGWVFPSPTDPEKSVRRDLVRDWWRQLERLAGLPRVRGRGWHSLRRKFATDLKTQPMSDLKALGGWRDTQTIVKCYTMPDETTMRDALASRAQRRAAAQ